MSLRDEVEAGLDAAHKVRSCEQLLSDRDERIRALETFVQHIASIRHLGGGQIVTGDEPFDGETCRIVSIKVFAQQAKALLAKETKQ